MSIATSEGESDQSGDDPQGWTIGFSGWPALVLRAPPRCLSSRKCMMSSLEHGRHLSLPETAPVAHPPSPPLTAERRGGIRRSRRWSDRFAMQLCPRTASTWRGNPLLASRACRHSSALTGSAYAACGEAASALHAMALLQVHQAKALRDLHKGGHDPGVLSELRTATDLALRAPKVTARSLGRAMSTMVVQERYLWQCLADMKEVDKARFLNAPVSQTGLFGNAVENFAQQFSAAQKQTEAIRHILPRAAASSQAAPRPSRPPPNQVASVEASGPETDDPGMEMSALREMVNAPLPPPEEGRAENLLFIFLPLASRSVVPKNSTKEQFPLSLGPQRGRGVVNESNLSYTHPPLSPVGSCGRFERAVNRTTHAPSAGTQVSASHTPTPLRTGNETPEPGPCVPPRCPTAGTSVASLVSLVRFWGAWLALPNPSHWLLRTIRLGYAIQFARRPPKYRGIHFTTVRAADAPILRAEIAVLLVKDAIEPVPPADMSDRCTATVAYINRQGGLRSRRMSQLARHLLLWSRKHLRSLRAIHIPGLLYRTADELSRAALPGEWRLHPQTVQLIWRRFGLAQVDLFASLETSHCQLFYSLTEGTLGTDALAHSWPQGLRKYAFPPVSLLAQTLCKVREEEEQVLLVAPYWPTRTWFPELMLLVTAPPWQIPLRKDLLTQRRGTLWHPRPDLWKLHVWSLDGTRRF